MKFKYSVLFHILMTDIIRSKLEGLNCDSIFDYDQQIPVLSWENSWVLRKLVNHSEIAGC